MSDRRLLHPLIRYAFVNWRSQHLLDMHQPPHLPSRRSRHTALAVMALVACVPGITVAAGESAITLPDGGARVLDFDPDSEVRLRAQELEASGRWSSVKDMPFLESYRVEASERMSEATNVRVKAPIRQKIERGEVVLISFWIRRPNAGGQPNSVYFSVNADDESGYTYRLSAYRDWKQHVRSFVAPFDFDPKGSDLRIDLGEAGKVTEIADLQLMNYGREYDITSLPKSTVRYRGRDPDALWRQQALERIEDLRKGDIKVRVVDARGDPLPNAKVTISMRQHAFGFGNAVNSEMLGAPETDFPIRSKRNETVTWEDAKKYRAVVKKYYDRVTFESELRPGNWKRLENGDENWRRKKNLLFEKTIPWLQANRIQIRGHYIAWAPMDFNAVEKPFVGDSASHRAWLWEHMADVLPATASFVSEWDTINHIVGWGKHTYELEYGGPEIYAEILAEARRLAPEATHAINEGKVLPDGYKRDNYKRLIRFLNDQDQPPDVVGFMAHFGLTTLTPPEELLEVYDDFAEIAPRLQLSEFDVEAGDDDALQADYFRDVMIATFSHPNFEAIVQWGFWEPMHWKPAAALWRRDWTLKPSGEVFVDLVTKQWWTDETVTTDSGGACQLRGFLGRYIVRAAHKDSVVEQEFTLSREGASLQLQL